VENFGKGNVAHLERRRFEVGVCDVTVGIFSATDLQDARDQGARSMGWKDENDMVYKIGSSVLWATELPLTSIR
jgi:hypothetical protein